MLGVTTVYGIGQILGIVFVCSPVSYNWTQWDGEHQGKVCAQNVLDLEYCHLIRIIG